MTPVQQSAFTAASGGGSSQALGLTIATIIFTLALLWLAWTTIALFQAWQSKTLEIGQLIWYLIRGAMLISILLSLVT